MTLLLVLIAREILGRGDKALVLTGTLHAFTRFAMPETHVDCDGFLQKMAQDIDRRYRTAE